MFKQLTKSLVITVICSKQKIVTITRATITVAFVIYPTHIPDLHTWTSAHSTFRFCTLILLTDCDSSQRKIINVERSMI
uniref:Secreted protein n=1 Tax=Steinernema glaseri TaxID=37863 RepID=A0A1I8ABZ8_9BILA